MIRLPSLQRQYNEHWSEDSSFQQAPADLPASASEDERKAHALAVAEYITKLNVAADTGDWSALRVEGAGEPTTFVMRPLSAETFGKLADLRDAGVGENEIYQLAFRAALVSVTNLGEAKVSLVDDEKLGRIASLGFLSEAGAAGMRLVREIGAKVLRRASSLSPKS